MSIDKCRICGKMMLYGIAAHKCPPKWTIYRLEEERQRVVIEENGESKTTYKTVICVAGDSPETYYATTPEQAVEEWAMNFDSADSSYTIVGGDEQRVLVVGDNRESAAVIVVSGETVPAYNAYKESRKSLDVPDLLKQTGDFEDEEDEEGDDEEEGFPLEESKDDDSA